MEATPHRLFGRKTLGAGFVDVVAALGTGVSKILPSLMIGVDQRIIAEPEFLRTDGSYCRTPAFGAIAPSSGTLS